MGFVVPDIYPCTVGGMEIFYNKLLNELSQWINVILFTTCPGIKSDSYKIIRVEKNLLKIPKTQRIGMLLNIAFAIIKNKQSIDCIHFPYTNNAGRWGYVFPILTKFFKIPYNLQIHSGGIIDWGARDINYTLFKSASKIMAVSQVLCDAYKKRLRRDVELVYPLVPFKKCSGSSAEVRIRLGFHLDDKIVIFVGTIKEIKAPIVLLDAINWLGKDYVNQQKIKVLYIGEGNLFEELQKKVNTFGLRENVVLLGKRPNEEMPDYYSIADVFVIPSFYEGTSKSLLEAMFNKLPIIGSDVIGINNIIMNMESGLLFPLNDSKELAERMRELLKDNNLREKLGLKAYDLWDKKYSFNTTLEKYLIIYSNCRKNIAHA